jgi:hypothetical protein
MLSPRKLVTMRLSFVGAVLLCITSLGSEAHAQTAAAIDNKKDVAGAAPTEFDLRGPWTIVRDPTAENDPALQHSPAPAVEDQFTFAAYRPAFLKNAEISLRLKTDGGQSDRAGGIAIRVSSPQDYYLVQLDALREEIIFSCVKDGNSEEIAGVDADIGSHSWHTLTIRAVENEFTVTFDGKWVFTGFDRAISQPGGIALWAKGDSLTRYDKISIIPLAVREEIRSDSELEANEQTRPTK